jgi:hypothetical protein
MIISTRQVGDANVPTTIQPQPKRSQPKKGRTMKKLTLMLLVAAMLNSPAAEAVFIPLSLQPGGPLHAGVPYTFRVGDAANGTAAMLQAVVRGRLELEETLTVPSGSSVDLVFTIPSRASRVILVLDLVLNGEVTVTVLDQIGNTVIPPRTFSFSTDPDPHLEVVYEVAP